MPSRWRYAPIPPKDPEDREYGAVLSSPPPRRRSQQRRRTRRLAFVIGIGFLAGMVILFLTTWGEMPRLRSSKSCHERANGYQCKPDISHNWGQYSPFHSIPSEYSSETPQGCAVVFAQVLSRHGSRDPTMGRTVIMGALIEKLHRDVRRFKGKHAFLKDYKYTLGADQLTKFGQEELYRSGQAFYNRYQFITRQIPPFVRASGQQRVIMSAENFTKGMFDSATEDKAKGLGMYPPHINVIPEGKNYNNTLSIDNCDAFNDRPYSSLGHEAQEEWANIFATPIAKRLNAGMPGANLSPADAIVLMDMCPYTTVASEEKKPTKFCDLFTKEEWLDYDYYQTLGKYYGHGPGNPLGPTQGVGWVNELIARLTDKPVDDHTTVNHTLDDDKKTFPRGPNHPLFADFSHDNDMMAIFSAMGFFNDTAPLDKTRRTPPEKAGGFSASWVLPFASRMYVENMQCRIRGLKNGKINMIRVLINDRVVKLPRCGADNLGRCRIENFVHSLKFARDGGKWDQCFKQPDDEGS